MMNKFAPDHIKKYCVNDRNDDLYNCLTSLYKKQYSFVYKIRCTCGCDKFMVYVDEHPSAFAKCTLCNEYIVIYDLKYYPSATKLNKICSKKQIGKEGVKVYVVFEYNDEFEDEEDVKFDSNDITWGKVFVRDKNGLMMILDDETA